MNIEKKDEFKDMLLKVLGGLLIAAISGSLAWSISTVSRVSVFEANQINIYQDVLQTQERLENNMEKINSIDKTIVGIFNSLKDIQKEQLELSKMQSEQMTDIKRSMDGLEVDVNYLKSVDSKKGLKNGR